MESLSPQALADLCQQRLPEDTRPFEALVAQMKDRVYATAYRLMGNREDAQDQAQEAFIKVYRGIRDLDDTATVTAWIYRLTVNACYDALRKRRASPSTVPSADSCEDGAEEREFVDGNAEAPEEEALRRELRECLDRVLQQLEPGERGVLVLRDVEDRPYQEIADSLTVGLAAVKMRIHRARLAFQRLYDRLCRDLWRVVPTHEAPEG